MVEIAIYANAVIFAALVAIRFQGGLAPRVVTFVWGTLSVAYVYYLVHLLGGSGPTFTFFSMGMPLYGALVLAAVAMTLTMEGRFCRPARLVLTLLVICGVVFSRTVATTIHLVDGVGLDVDRGLGALLFVVVLLLVGLSPLTAFMGGGKSAIQRLAPFSLSELRKDFVPIATSFVLCVLVYVVFNELARGRIADFHYVGPLRSFAMSVTTDAFHYVILDHLICFGLAKYIIDSIFKGEETSMWEIVIFAGLFAFFHMEMIMIYIVRSFFFGLVFGYLYLKTRTLVYGIAIGMLFVTFTT